MLSQVSIVKTVRLPANYHLDNAIFNKKVYNIADLNFYEDVHCSLETYVWLSYKYEIEFVERELARVLKDRVCKIIDSIIEKQAYDNSRDIRNETTEKEKKEEIKCIEEKTQDEPRVEEENI